MKDSDNYIEMTDKSDRLLSYFKKEKRTLAVVTVSGVIYNIGMTAGPYFEGELVQCLYDCFNSKKTYIDMLNLALIYLAVILTVQTLRAVKRFYTRRFANNISRRMRHTIYSNIVNSSGNEPERDNMGAVMTKAVSDVDACAEGMRKFTTEVFDTGVVLVSYIVMLLIYDWRLTFISCAFIPAAYIIASKLKKVITDANERYKESAGCLNQTTYDRVENAVTYRIYGRETDMDARYADALCDYEKKAVRANIWEGTLQPLYNVIAMIGTVFIIYFGSCNVSGNGWSAWDIGMFTTYMSCFAKMALKSSKAAKLFNAVQKAMVSWARIKPLMKMCKNDADETCVKVHSVCIDNMSCYFEPDKILFSGLNIDIKPGDIIGVTGTVACGKSAFGKVFIKESCYDNSVMINGQQVSELSVREISQRISYMGHQPELFSASVGENILLGKYADEPEKASQEIKKMMRLACIDGETESDEYVGNGGVMLSGGQQARIAYARTLCHARDVIILDDPYSAVDKETEAKMFDNLRGYLKDRIVILISHRLAVFPKTTKVVYIHDKTADVGTHRQLYAENESYRMLADMQEVGAE